MPATRPGAGNGPYEYVGSVEGIAGLWGPTPFSRDGAALLTRANDGSFRIWDTHALKPLSEPLRHQDIRFARLLASGNTLFTAGGTEVRFWDVTTSRPRSTLQVSRRRLKFADVSADGARFVTVTSEDAHHVAIWRLGAAQPDVVLQHRSIVRSAEFDQSGSRLVTHEVREPAFHVWDALTGREVGPPIEGNDSDSPLAFQARLDAVGKHLVVARPHGFAVIALATGISLAEGRWDGDAEPSYVRISADGTRAAVVTPLDDGGSVRVFDAATGTPVRTFGSDVFDCELDPSGALVLCHPYGRLPKEGSDGPQVPRMPELRDAATGALVQRFPKADHERGTDAYMSLDGTLIACPASSWKTDLWRLRVKGDGKRYIPNSDVNARRDIPN